MINAAIFTQALKARGAGLFTGVPDSTLSSFCAYLSDNAQATEHVIAANEGNAVAIAAGHHLATGGLGVVYMQNSGLGNALNPLVSLAAPEVYRIPVLLVVGWRGEPGVHDEPQHAKQGGITLAQLDLIGVPYWIADADVALDTMLDAVFNALRETNAPVAIVVRSGSFEKYAARRTVAMLSALRREEALRALLSLADSSDLLLATTGKASRELFELRAQAHEAQRDFLTVGSMGHVSSLALGVALGNPLRRVICLDGDGALLMHMGALAVIGQLKPRNLLHVLLNNGAHESVGGQPTAAGGIDFAKVAAACGYNAHFLARDIPSLRDAWDKAKQVSGPVLLEVQVAIGSRKELGRPSVPPCKTKELFMSYAHNQ